MRAFNAAFQSCLQYARKEAFLMFSCDFYTASVSNDMLNCSTFKATAGFPPLNFASMPSHQQAAIAAAANMFAAPPNFNVPSSSMVHNAHGGNNHHMMRLHCSASAPNLVPPGHVGPAVQPPMPPPPVQQHANGQPNPQDHQQKTYLVKAYNVGTCRLFSV